jgi:hypothetical protein
METARSPELRPRRQPLLPHARLEAGGGQMGCQLSLVPPVPPLGLGREEALALPCA